MCTNWRATRENELHEPLNKEIYVYTEIGLCPAFLLTRWRRFGGDGFGRQLAARRMSSSISTTQISWLSHTAARKFSEDSPTPFDASSHGLKVAAEGVNLVVK